MKNSIRFFALFCFFLPFVMMGQNVEVKPIFGYRFVVVGDFDGNGAQDTLTEHVFSALTGKEMNKFYDGIDYDSTVALTIEKKPFCFISCNNPQIDTIRISTPSGQLFGLSFLHNEGDLDGDGADELSYVADYADWSSLNTCHLLTFKKGTWKELLAFEIRDWELPELPGMNAQYSLFGVSGMTKEQSEEREKLEETLRRFSFIRKISNRLIHVYTHVSDEKDVRSSRDLGDPIIKKIRLKK